MSPRGLASSSRRGLGLIRRQPWLVIGMIALVAGALWVKSTRTQTHHVLVAFDTVISLRPGLDVQVDGVDVGKISSVELSDGQAIVGLGIDDEQLWPLHRGTTAAIRFGTTIGNGTRRVDVEPGPASAPAIPEGGIIGPEHSSSPVEFDQVFNMMDRKTRADMQELLPRSSATLSGRSRQLNSGFREMAPAFQALGGMMSELAADELALRSLVLNARRTTRALASRSDQLSDLMTVAAATFDEFRSNSQEVRDSLQTVPPALRETRTTLARLHPTFTTLEELFADLRPGARQLEPFVQAARPALAELRPMARTGVGALRDLRAGAPTITRLLRDLRPFSIELGRIIGLLRIGFECIRPYGPEIGGFLSTWASYTQGKDATGHYGRVRINPGPTPAEAKFAVPRPPGLNAGQPWYRPSCQATAESFDRSTLPPRTP